MTEKREWSEVAPGLFRICVADVNCHLLRTADGITLFDGGLPATKGPLSAVLAHLGADLADIDALVLTHGHFDHVGVARGLRAGGSAVLVHPRDAELARHPYSYRPAAPRIPYLLTHPKGIPVIARMAANGALAVKGVSPSAHVTHGRAVDAPGAPIALWTPGHTDGHCAYLLEDAGILIAGDALVTLDPYTGETGAQIVASAATSDTDMALHSLDVLEETDAALMLPGHGEPSRAGVRADVAEARRRGAH